MLSARSVVAGAVALACASNGLFAQPSAEPPRQKIVDVRAAAETTPVASDGDSADDPAIWVTRDGRAWILGTDKKAGLAVYDLEGNQVAFVPCGRVNNVDIRGQVQWQGRTGVLAAATHRDRKTVDLFWLDDQTGALTAAGSVKTGLAEPYGMTLGKTSRGDLTIFAGDKSGRTEQYVLGQPGANASEWSLARVIGMASQSEGMACDDRAGVFYIAEEAGGVWSMAMEGVDTTAQPFAVISKDAASSGSPLTPDVEGLAIARTGETAYLVVSSQGDNTFAVFQTPSGRHVGSFRIVDGPSIDGVHETDGIDVVTAALGPNFPRGLLVVQDGVNVASDLKTPQGQNFKYVSWADVEKALGLGQSGTSLP